jgi:RimJ/RimL family protein N-acetyltransferase
VSRDPSELGGPPAAPARTADGLVFAPPTLHTPRLVLRAFVPADGDAVAALAGEREIASTTLNIPHPYERPMADAWIASHAAAYAAGTGVTFAMVARDGDVLVGAMGLARSPRFRNAELGYWVGVPYWGRGYATEAVRAVLDWAFAAAPEGLGLHRVHAAHLTRNPSSGRVMQKAGMRWEGCRREHVLKWDRFEDLAIYGVLAEEWRAMRAAPDATGERATGERATGERATADRLRAAVERGATLLLALSADESAARRTPGAWSPREVVGHLIDSAANNHGRFVRAQLQDDLVFPGYAQDAWVAAQDYRHAPWAELVALWRAYNLHLARVIERVPADVRTRERSRHNLHEIAWRPVPADRPATLDYFMRDYVDHLEHHLAQVVR